MDPRGSNFGDDDRVPGVQLLVSGTDLLLHALSIDITYGTTYRNIAKRLPTPDSTIKIRGQCLNQKDLLALAEKATRDGCLPLPFDPTV